MKTNEKIVIYQVLCRLFGNMNMNRVHNGTIEQNGCGKMNDFTEPVLTSIKALGCNYIWFTGLLQQATQTDYTKYGIPRQNAHVTKGVAGSPYAICDYYAISADLAQDPANRMNEFKALVERTHKADLKIIMDFVPNHVAREYKSVMKPLGVRDLGEDDDQSKAFDTQNNFYYMPGQPFAPQIDLGSGDEQYKEMPAKATGNDCFHAYPGINDWYETIKLNYGIDYCGGGRYCFEPMPSTWKKMLDILMYWAEMGVDGFRCDMAFLVPVDFWHWAIAEVKKVYPDVIFIAEIYDPGLYRSYTFWGGFDYLYDKVGLYDTLRAVVECKASAAQITKQWQSVEGLQHQMVNFLENHDEQRLASDFFAGDAEKGKPALAVSALMNTNPFMLYFGQELGERGMDEEGFSGKDGRTTIFDYWALPSMKAWHGEDGQWSGQDMPKEMAELRSFYAKVLQIATQEEVFSEGAFYDLMYANYHNPYFDANRQYVFFRCNDKSIALVVANFNADDKNVEINVPIEARNYAKWADGKYQVTDLMTNETSYCTFDSNMPVKVSVSGYGVAILKFNIG